MIWVSFFFFFFKSPSEILEFSQQKEVERPTFPHYCKSPICEEAETISYTIMRVLEKSFLS